MDIDRLSFTGLESRVRRIDQNNVPRVALDKFDRALILSAMDLGLGLGQKWATPEAIARAKRLKERMYDLRGRP